jgi:putative ABC transport system permease protein
MMSGDPKTALQAPNSLVLTQTTAQKLFGSEDPLGQEVLFENLKPFKITGVIKDPPIQSHIQFDILGSLSTMVSWQLDVYGDQQLGAAYIYAYLRLEKNTDRKALAEKLTDLVGSLKTTDGGSDRYHLQPLEQIHLYSQLDQEIGVTGQGNNIWLLMGIAVLILFLGWVNHFNLFSANVFDQTPSLSVRRIVGATSKQIFLQLAFSAAVFSLLGLIAGIIIMLFSEPIIENIFGIPISNFSIKHFSISAPALLLFILIVLGTLANSLLPALTFSKIQPSSVLSRHFSARPQNINIRKTLVIFQFMIIIALIATTSIIYRQTQFMQDKNLGLSLEDVISVRAPLGTGYDNLVTNFPRFQQEILGVPEIKHMSVSHNIPGNELELVENLIVNNKEYSFTFYRNYGNLDYFQTYQIPFIIQDTNVNFALENQRYCVINKTASELLGYEHPEDALHQKIEMWGSEIEITGVVENYHQRSLHHPMAPIIYDISSDGLLSDGYYSFKTINRSQAFISKIQVAYQRAFPYTVFDVIQVQDYFDSQYKKDNDFKKLNLGFTLLGLIIACFGLLGLMIITVDKRTKELGIRKVLGASTTTLMLLLSKDMIKITGLAWVLATPLVWYFMNQWLDSFSARIQIGWSVFIWSGILVLIAAFLTTSFQTIKAAMVDPAKILKDE